MKYAISAGKVIAKNLEINVAQHCNLRCRSCSHLSPVLPHHYIDLDELRSDLAALTKVYHARTVRILGGEPLLHPKLLDLIDIVRAAQIGDTIRIATNGTLLPRMSHLFWQRVDEVYVSLYPGTKLAPSDIEQCQTLAVQHNVKLEILYFDRFRISYSEIGTDDGRLTNRIYSVCQIVHHWQCHTISRGFFYRCPQSLYLPQLLGIDIHDGLKIEDSPTFLDRLHTFLLSSEPMKSCAWCLGSTGRLFGHEQVDRRDWRALQQAPTEELVDMNYLKSLECTSEDLPALCMRHELNDEFESSQIILQ